MRIALVSFLSCAAMAHAVQAHEFWIEPSRLVASTGDEVSLDLRVGGMLNGQSYPYLSQKIIEYALNVDGESFPANGREGDIPSLRYIAEIKGLNVISYHAAPEQVVYQAFSDFEEYLADEGLGPIAERHRQRGLPDTGFIETYTRNSKALIQVGPVVAGQADTNTGMPFELVALGNPYSAPEVLPVALIWQSEPVSEAQVAIFHRSATGAVTRTTVTTNTNGVASIPLERGGFFLLSSVILEERDPETDGAAWHSTWAALSFGVPLD